MEAKVYSIDGKETGKTIELPDSIFGQEPNENAVHLDVVQYLAAKRQGTAKTKERAEIAGSTKKIKRQKGTGTARAGSIKSPLFKGGGTIFGPKPRNYNLGINKKVSKIARKSALSQKAQNNKIVVLDKLEFDTPKTKNIINIIDSFKLSDRKKLFLVDELNKSVYLSSRNLKDVNVLVSKDVNTYSVMNSNVVFMTEGAVEQLVKTLS